MRAGVRREIFIAVARAGVDARAWGIDANYCARVHTLFMSLKCMHLAVALVAATRSLNRLMPRHIYVHGHIDNGECVRVWALARAYSK